jgi:hypothetical protein
MFLGAYHFAGDPSDLLPAYDRLMSGFDPSTFDLHVCAVRPEGLVVLDTCPTEEVFRTFSTGDDFRGACRRAGLPEPRIEHLGTVHQAILREAVQG